MPFPILAFRAAFRFLCREENGLSLEGSAICPFEGALSVHTVRRQTSTLVIEFDEALTLSFFSDDMSNVEARKTRWLMFSKISRRGVCHCGGRRSTLWVLLEETRARQQRSNGTVSTDRPVC